ncbi:MAG: NAD-dependent DNA ligase LigA [Treponema sp.]|nr:NAD-dependent DNA ligase LigA [Treponema sp.]
MEKTKGSGKSVWSADAAEEHTSARIAVLVSLITRYQKSYYNGEAEISDNAFDALWDELAALDPANGLLHTVGADSGTFKKVRHVMPMGSQEKAADPEQFRAWAAKHVYDEYLVEYKLDGASLELQYQDGVLVHAVTRGDGETGDDITANACRMRGVISSMHRHDGEHVAFTGGIRGEVIMTRAMHREKYVHKANCRNAANGIMRRKDGTGSEDLELIVYDAWATVGTQPFADEVEKIAWLSSCGFTVVPLIVCPSVEAVITCRAETIERRPSLPYDIDGLVVKERAINHEDTLRARPDRQIAFKFSLEEAVTVIRAVEWSTSGATYTPVAVFDPVELAGTIVQRASLANPDTMRALGVSVGSTVIVVKRGDIIPKIESVVPDDGSALVPVSFPTTCERCGTQLVDDGSRLYCPNVSCPKRVLHRLLKWVRVVDIRDFGETLVTSLFNAGKLSSVSDIYALTVTDVVPFFLSEESRAADKKSLGAEKVIRSIQSHRAMGLAAFVAGFDIEGIGETTVEKLIAAGYDTLEKLLTATEEQFAAVYGFAAIMAHTAVEGLRENALEMRALAETTITLFASTRGVLSGTSFCFTGELKTMKRSAAEQLVKDQGGTVKSTVSAGLSYLVTNDTTSGSSKNVKAAKLGVPVITETEFLALVHP